MPVHDNSLLLACVGTRGDCSREKLWAWESNLPFIPPTAASPTELKPRSEKYQPAVAECLVLCFQHSSEERHIVGPNSQPLRTI